MIRVEKKSPQATPSTTLFREGNFIEITTSIYYHCSLPVYMCYLVFDDTVYSPLPDSTHATPSIIVAELQLSTKYFQNLIVIYLAQHSNPSLYILIRFNIMRRRQCITYQTPRSKKPSVPCGDSSPRVP
jgi:hypothetical protein